MDLSIVFMGSPEFALPTLQALVDHYSVAGVVTQPDRPAGRGRALTAPPVKRLAQQLGLPVIQPRRLRDPDAMQQLRSWNPQLIVVAAFGQILKPEVLELPRYGCLNVHASLLPRWRGAAPIQAAILNGDSKTGVTIMKMDPGVDTGPILSQSAIEIVSNDTTLTLTVSLARLGADLLVETLPPYLSGELEPQPQSEEGATYAPMLKKEDGLLDFNQPAEALSRRVQAFNPWPGASLLWQGQIVKVLQAHPLEDERARPGKNQVVDGLPAVGAAGGFVVLDEVQPAGKKPMPGKAFLQGARGWIE